MKWTAFILFLLLATAMAKVQAYALSGQYLGEDGSTKSFSRFQGKLLIVDATASWCSGCEVQLSYLKTVQNSVSNVTILTLSVDPAYDTIDKMLTLKNRNQATWEFGIDQNSDFQNIHPVSSLPSVFLLDEQGNLIQKWGQITTAKEIVNAILAYRGSPTLENDNDLAQNDETLQENSLVAELLGNPIVQLFTSLFVVFALYMKIGRSTKPVDQT